MSGAARRFHVPAAERNREPILAVLRRVLPSRGLVLEVGAGSGQHAAFFSSALPGLTWQPTDADPAALGSIDAWRGEHGPSDQRDALLLDCAAGSWPVGTVDAIYNANTIHISPWPVALGLLRGAGRHLRDGAPLVLYGPFALGGVHTAPSNARFDADLRAMDPRFGVRDLDAVEAAAAPHGVVLDERVEMPSNNQIVIFRRAARDAPERS